MPALPSFVPTHPNFFEIWVGAGEEFRISDFEFRIFFNSLCALSCSFACPVESRRLSFGEFCALSFALKLVLDFGHLDLFAQHHSWNKSGAGFVICNL
ncbi:hypothetical protein J7K44_02365 [bacterium]|nr:hypothetical protein [bacterium]